MGILDWRKTGNHLLIVTDLCPLCKIFVLNVSKVIHQALFVYFLFSRLQQAETVKKNKHCEVKLPILLCVISIPLVKRLYKYYLLPLMALVMYSMIH